MDGDDLAKAQFNESSCMDSKMIHGTCFTTNDRRGAILKKITDAIIQVGGAVII
jgi:hypothetical protein